jgi:hypothetical protein
MKRDRKLLGIIAAILSLLIPFFLMLYNKNDHLATDQSLCPFKMLTGLPCPGCGITKSLVYFYQGDLYKSFGYHIMGPFLLFFCLGVVVIFLAELYTKKEYLNRIFYSKKVIYFLVFFLVFYHIIRIGYFLENNNYDSILKQSIWK